PPPSPLSCHPHRAPPAPYTSPYTTLFRSTMSEPGTQPATHAFLSHRGLLFTVAYEILGSATDAEDVLQETWLRWAQVDLDRVRDRRAYLLRIATRQALNHARSLNRRKETYVGSWLPEPLLTSP